MNNSHVQHTQPVCVGVLVCQSPLKVKVELRVHVAWFAPASAANIRAALRQYERRRKACGEVDQNGSGDASGQEGN